MRVRAGSTRRTHVAIVGLIAISLLATACGGAKSGSSDSSSKTDLQAKGLDAQAGESGLADAGTPRRGGKLIYGLEADTNGGFCLTEGQLAISGMMIVRAVYDTLTVPNDKGDYIPYLAKTIDHDSTYKTWTITLRPNIKFHDGSPLTAQVVKNNLDAYRGVYPGRDSLLLAFNLRNIDTVTTAGPLTVKVTTKVPWVAFPSYLYSSSRLGIMAQAQLDDKSSCARKLIGTGPFKFVSWTPNQKLDVKRNPDYWQIAPDGKPYPYVDSIEFRPITDGQVRNNALQAGDINIMHTSNAKDMGAKLLQLRNGGKVNMLVSEKMAEISFVQLNSTVAPFNDPLMRKALAMGGNRVAINKIVNAGLPNIADGPFSPDSIAYLKNPGFPKYDPAAAKKLVQEYVAKGGKAEFTLTSTTDQSVRQTAALIQQQAQALGVKVRIVQRDQAALINDAIAKKYQAMVFRNYPGGDPDSMYVWWYGGTKGEDGTFAPNLVNFAGVNDPDMNKLLDEGRSETDPAKRKTIYQNLNRILAGKVYGIWSWYTPWAVVEQSKVHNILGPPLPGADPSKPGKAKTTDPEFEPSKGLATGHSLIGLWISN